MKKPFWEIKVKPRKTRFSHTKKTSKTFNNREWSTVSKAEEKSRHRSIVDMLESEDKMISLCSFCKAVSVEWPILRPDWEDWSKENLFK